MKESKKEHVAGFSINRGIILFVLLIAIVFCGVVIAFQAQRIDALKTEVTMINMQLQSVSETLREFQTATTKTLDTLNSDVRMHDSLITELERMNYVDVQ